MTTPWSERTSIESGKKMPPPPSELAFLGYLPHRVIQVFFTRTKI
jgi:hypothetical protein